ncbi:hypothetical protein D3C73_816110 [compost metagenome]
MSFKNKSGRRFFHFIESSWIVQISPSNRDSFRICVSLHRCGAKNSINIRVQSNVSHSLRHWSVIELECPLSLFCLHGERIPH